MALTERSLIDKIEIVGEFKQLQVRRADIIERDGVEISRSFHRHIVTPNMDISGQHADVQAVANVLWTDELKASYASYLESVELPGTGGSMPS